MDRGAWRAAVRGVAKELDTTERLKQNKPVFFPGEFHGLRSLAGYSSWGHKELDMTGQTRQRSVGKTWAGLDTVLFTNAAHFAHLDTGGRQPQVLGTT